MRFRFKRNVVFLQKVNIRKYSTLIRLSSWYLMYSYVKVCRWLISAVFFIILHNTIIIKLFFILNLKINLFTQTFTIFEMLKFDSTGHDILYLWLRFQRILLRRVSRGLAVMASPVLYSEL